MGIERCVIGTVFRTFKIFYFIFSFFRAFRLTGKVRERAVSRITHVYSWAYERMIELFTEKNAGEQLWSG